MFGEGIQNDRIQAILEANVVPKLVMLLRPSKSRSVPISVQLAALQVLGNVACGDDRQTQVVIDSNALPCLRALLSSSDRQIRKEVCWIVSNITESSHQVQDVLDADILPPLLKLLDNQDGACREDATWVLFNLSSNRDPKQISYLAEKNGVRALCNLLTCQKDLDVLWKGCGTVAAVALKGLRNILISGQMATSPDLNGYNVMASLVAEAHGVERIEALTTHVSPDVRNRARLILERMFGAEPTTVDLSPVLPSPSVSALHPFVTPPLSPMTVHANCSCEFQQTKSHRETHRLSHLATHSTQTRGVCGVAGTLISATETMSGVSQVAHGHSDGLSHVLPESDLVEVPGCTSASASSTDSDPEDDDSDSDLLPPPPEPCSCLLCADSSPLAERRARGKHLVEDFDSSRKSGSLYSSIRSICEFCSGSGRLGDGRAGLASKLGRSVRMGHPHCLAILLSKMTWSQRSAAIEAPALLHPGGGPPDGGVGSSLPAVILAAQLGKPSCLRLLLSKCRPDLDISSGKKRLTALAWAAHKGYLLCCQLLLQHGANPATKCGDGVTALHLAASGGGNVTVCKLLIDHKAPVNLRSVKKQTPLCLAAQKGFSKVVHLLIEHGADPNNEAEGKYTPLHLSASNGYAETVEVLLGHGARVDVTTRNEVTPLHYAVRGGHSDVVKALVSAGANVNCNKKPLLLIAADDGKGDIVNLLLDAGASIDCRANIRAMLDKEMEICDYLTPLHLAASKNHYDVVELLLRRGANVNELTSKSGWSSLDFAVLNGHSESAIVLLQRGAIVTETCKNLGRNNWTLVQYAASNGAKDVVRLLIQRLKEQNSSLALISDGGSTPVLNRPPVPSKSAAWPVVESRKSDEQMNSSYAVGNNVHTCRACSKLRHSGCMTVSNQQVHGSVDISGNELRRYESQAEEAENGLSHSSMYNGMSLSENELKSTASRRRKAHDDRQSTLRAREIKRREAEALCAKLRLEEAISQRSVSKLTEAISHVSKLVLHLAAPVGSDSTTGYTDRGDVEDYSTHREVYGHTAHGQTPNHKQISNTTNAPLVPAPLVTEVGLGNEVRKARKLLVSLLAEEKRVKEEKEREAMDSRRESVRQTVRKAITVALEGGDPRSLSRAINRATRTILEKDDPVILKALSTASLIAKLEKSEQAAKLAMKEENLGGLSEALIDLKTSAQLLMEMGATGAMIRVFERKDPLQAVSDAEHALRTLQEKQEREEALRIEAEHKELRAREELNEAMKSGDALRLELALNKAQKVLISKQSALAGTLEVAKKVLAKRLKTERRKLRQASSKSDPLKIDEAAAKAEKLGLTALSPDIEAARAQAHRLREQAATVELLKKAVVRSDVNALTDLRSKLNSLGMFTEAEKARAELERLQRTTRARSLLEGAIEECKARCEPIKELLKASKPTDHVMEHLTSWTWPDMQRLRDLSDRARQYGSSQSALRELADRVSCEVEDLGHQILDICVKSDDARAIAAMIARYENAFPSVSKSKKRNNTESEHAVSAAKKHLAHIQAMDQASIKAESAQVKVEYALATSRRSAARNRQCKPLLSTRATNPETSASSTLSGPNGNNVFSVESQTRSSSTVSSEFADDDVCESEATTRSIPCYEYDQPRAPQICRNGASRKGHVLTPQSYDSTFRDSYENASVIPEECSHFYLFKEGTTVYCARCGNHRNSSNPEWLARVKRRGTKILSDMVAESSEGTEGSYNQIHHGSGGQHNVHTASLTGGASPVNGRFVEPKVLLPSSTSIPSSQSYLFGALSHIRDGSEAMAMRSNAAASSANVLVPMLQQQAKSHPMESGSCHGIRPTAQQVAVSAKPVGQAPTLYSNGVNTTNSVLPTQISVAGSMRGTSAYLPSGIQRIPTRLCTEQSSMSVYELNKRNSSLPTEALLASSGISLPLAERRETQHDGGPRTEMQMRSTVDTEIDLNRAVQSEEAVEGGRDLGVDFANENFGFDIDSIVDESAPPQSKAASNQSFKLVSDISEMHAANPRNRNGFFHR